MAVAGGGKATALGTSFQLSDSSCVKQIKGDASLIPPFTCFSKEFLVIGHRGMGMNALTSSDKRMKAIKENSIASFNAAAKFPIDFIEFDVQVTKDGYPVVFHDNFILYEDSGITIEKRVTDMSLSEFLSYGPQISTERICKNLLRKCKDQVLSWLVDDDDSLCTLQDVFQQVKPSVGFNIEIKFDDLLVYHHHDLTNIVQSILEVVLRYAGDRPILFSSFNPEAASIVRKLQSIYPVFFLTNGGTEIFSDSRRNSLEAAIKVCLEGGLQGIVSEARAVFTNPASLPLIKEAKLSFLTYGKLNNIPECVYLQYLMNIDGVIVDFVKEVTHTMKYSKETRGSINCQHEDCNLGIKLNPRFSQEQLAFLVSLIGNIIMIDCK